jgi:putative Mn2+ efflux pump MntP
VGYFVFSEIPTLNNYIGNIIIIGAGLYIVFREMQLKKNIVTSTARHPTIPIKKD